MPETFALFKDPAALPPMLSRPVLAIGNFDGMHRGHKVLFAEARRLAAATGRPAGLLTFEPHPRAFMRPDEPFFRLTSLEDKAQIAAGLGLDLVVALSFDAALRALAPEQFVAEILVARLGPSGAVIGPNFRYGRGRAADATSLVVAGEQAGFSVRVVDLVAGPGARIYASSAIRDLLRAGRVAEAADDLGHFWFLRSIVRHGDKRGRDLGFPTANMSLPEHCGLAHGIYAVRGRIDGRVVDGVASFGRRPTFDNGLPKLETYFLDFAGDLYGRDLSIEFIDRIRGEEKFESIEALVMRMHADVAAARAIFETLPARGVTSAC